MSVIVFLSYWLFGLRLPTLGFVGYWVELGLGAEMRNSGDLTSMNNPWGLRLSVSPVVRTQSSHRRSFGGTLAREPRSCKPPEAAKKTPKNKKKTK